MNASIRRVRAMLARYLYLHRRSLPRTFEIVFWPVTELLVWGFVMLYLESVSANPAARLFGFLISAMIFWDLLYRSQQSVSISFVEDIWTQNIVNLLVSPLRIAEWISATLVYGLLKVTLITSILGVIAWTGYRYDFIGTLGPALVPLAFNLLLFGWALGIGTSGLVLRWGHSAEALIWGVPYLIQPLSAIYYPVTVLPEWLRPLAYALPSTHVFEGVRRVVSTGRMDWTAFGWALGLNAVYFVLAALAFTRLFRSARRSGRLGRLGMD